MLFQRINPPLEKKMLIFQRKAADFKNIHNRFQYHLRLYFRFYFCSYFFYKFICAVRFNVSPSSSHLVRVVRNDVSRWRV